MRRHEHRETLSRLPFITTGDKGAYMAKNKLSFPEYNYMDTLDHDGWRWEFQRRLDSFRTDYELLKDIKNIFELDRVAWKLGDKYSMTKEARQNLSCLDPLLKYPDLPDNVKPVFEQTVPIKSLHRKNLLKEIRKTLKYWSYAGKDNPVLHMEPEEYFLLAVEMSIRPGMFPQNIEYMGINLDASRTDLRESFEKFLKTRIREKTLKGDEKKNFGAHKADLIVWDLRAQRKTFPQIQNITGINKDTAKKKFYRGYELIYGKKYNVADYERPPIRKKYQKNVCHTCDQRDTCKTLCPDVIAFVNQDNKNYGREMSVGDLNLLNKMDKEMQD